MLHEEADGVAAFTASKALVNFFGRGYGERWCFFVVKWALSEVVYATLFKPYKAADHLHDIDPAKYLLYGMLTYQMLRTVWG